jgi:hypothetical protein
MTPNNYSFYWNQILKVHIKINNLKKSKNEKVIKVWFD